MSEKLPGDTNKGNEHDTGLEEIGVHRVSSEEAMEDSKVIEKESTEESTPEELIEVETVELQEAKDIDVLEDEVKMEETEKTEESDENESEKEELETVEFAESVDETVTEKAEEAIEDLEQDVEHGSEDQAEIEEPSEDGVKVVAKYPSLKAKKPLVAIVLRNIFLVLLILWIAFVFVAPLLLPQGIDTPNLDINSGQHFLGTDSAGRDVLSNVLRAGSKTLILTLIPTLVGFFGILLTYRSWSDPIERKSRAVLMRPMPFTVISIVAFFVLGLYLPRSWTYFIIVVFLAVVLWLREAFAFARYIKAYRQAPHNHYSYYLGARELDNIRYTYGQEVRAAFLHGLLNIFLRGFLIFTVLPFADNSLTVPLRADWASQVLLPLQQGISFLDIEVLPHFIGWGITLVLVLVLLFINHRIAMHQTALSTMRLRANHWRAGDEV